MSSSGQPYTGPLTIDVTALAGLLIDLPPGEKQGLRTEKEGMSGVIAELASAVPGQAGADAGIPDDAYKVFVDTTDGIGKIRAVRAVVDKLAEVLDESEAILMDARENAVGSMVDAASSNAHRRRRPSILAPFEKTLAYNSQVADKAAKTRKKNAEAKKTGGNAGGGSNDPTP